VSAKFRIANNLVFDKRFQRNRNFVTQRRQVISLGMAAACVVPILGRAEDAVAVFVGDDAECVEYFVFNRLGHPFDMGLQVR